MKHPTAPPCPRCNSHHAVQKTTEAVQPAESGTNPDREGYTLGGHCIRPESPEWYCKACAESFGATREYWGDPLTVRIQ